MVFTDHYAPLRTHQSFINRGDPAFYVVKSLIEEIGINMVDDVVIDYMHAVCLGVMKKLIKFWSERDTRQHLISNDFVSQVSERLQDIRQFVPVDFARLPQPLSIFSKWKATELRQFLLYSGPIVLKGLLPEPL